MLKIYIKKVRLRTGSLFLYVLRMKRRPTTVEIVYVPARAVHCLTFKFVKQPGKSNAFGLGPFQTSHFSCAEYNANEVEQ